MTSKLSASILGISVWGPGLDGWAASHPILAGTAPYQPRDAAPPPAPLPSAERRRSGPVVRLALAAAQDASGQTGHQPGAMRNVFASSTGDGPVVGAILDALAPRPGATADDRVVSPTQFHNSVHNAPSGYWSIAVASRQPATCLGCHDDTFAAGLLAALAEHHACDATPVLYCCYDHTLPPPLDEVRPVGPPFAAALVLGRGLGPTLTVVLEDGPAQLCTPLFDLAGGSPAARSLPLLAALARSAPAKLALPYLGNHLTLTVTP